MGATSVDWRAKEATGYSGQMFPKYDKKQFANVVTGDETWVHYFEPVRKVSNKIWATKHSKRPIIAKRFLSTKKVLYAIFFSGEGVAIKVPVKKGKSITGRNFSESVKTPWIHESSVVKVCQSFKFCISDMIKFHGSSVVYPRYTKM